MKMSMGICVLVVLLCASSANAFNFGFKDTKVIEVTSETSPRIPLWQSAKVEKGDTFSQYCVEFLRTSGLYRHYSQLNCFDSIKSVNGYTKSQLHWIYPGQIVWLPSLQKVRPGGVAIGGKFVDVEELRILLGLDELESKIDSIRDGTQLSETVSKEINGVVKNILPNLVTDEVEKRVTEVKSTLSGEFEDKSYVPWGFFWLVALLLVCLVILGELVRWLRPIGDSIARQTANNAQYTADRAEATAINAVSKKELIAVSSGIRDQLQDIHKRVYAAQSAADEAGELAASAMALLRFGDFKVVDGYPTQTAVEKLKPDEMIVVKLAHIDNEEDVREINFTCVADALSDGRDGLKIDGITNQRRPIAKQLRSIATALANGARANHLQGVKSKAPK